MMTNIFPAYPQENKTMAGDKLMMTVKFLCDNSHYCTMIQKGRLETLKQKSFQ